MLQTVQFSELPQLVAGLELELSSLSKDSKSDSEDYLDLKSASQSFQNVEGLECYLFTWFASFFDLEGPVRAPSFRDSLSSGWFDTCDRNTSKLGLRATAATVATGLFVYCLNVLESCLF
jgi:hypothetical protein